ncbi:aliphatic sulfonate ABC transporter substrate-binding protein [Micromonospora yasonensis]|uniref:aliphatic sulfonate ABC transporter substrate-binding protein n=1 Tax=Micromonospora yasonensis TaxID=1128667 RepID=UPI00222F6D46|nr:aliphatic sulfonate ABC transporter substrate-binding protein [Micromonospora yasonensis]MCW3840431.1 aliphatic sulfonate ABC transporter substrate-binding protein [Micromonospora yasonensis]
MRISRRLLAGAAAGAIVAALLSGCGSDSGPGGKAEEVTFGYIGDFNGTSLLAIANDQKLWAKHGLKADTKVFTNGPLQIQALGAGDLDFGYIGPGAMWLPASGQAKVVAINTLGNADRVIAQPGVTSIQQLKGKTVGVPEGTSGDMILTLALRKAGVTKQDVKIVPMDPSTIVSAFSAKKIDAAGFWYPAIATIKKQVPDVVELAKNEDFAAEVSFPTAFVAGNQVVANEKAKTEKVLAVLRDAMRYRSENMDRSIALTAKILNVPVDQVKADAANVKVLSVDELDTMTKDGTIDKWLTGMSDYFVQAGKLKSPSDPKSYYTGDLFMAAAK